MSTEQHPPQWLIISDFLLLTLYLAVKLILIYLIYCVVLYVVITGCLLFLIYFTCVGLYIYCVNGSFIIVLPYICVPLITVKLFVNKLVWCHLLLITRNDRVLRQDQPISLATGDGKFFCITYMFWVILSKLVSKVLLLFHPLLFFECSVFFNKLS